ncbi:hypothetical protein ERJ75_000816700 [Trypanosoma vivax]|nr:hypothetical protein ERJ75_000816700 [Trypanosoma vivax]
MQNTHMRKALRAERIADVKDMGVTRSAFVHCVARANAGLGAHKAADDTHRVAESRLAGGDGVEVPKEAGHVWRRARHSTECAVFPRTDCSENGTM